MKENVKAHPTVPGASVVCGNLDRIPKRVKLVAGHLSACSVLFGFIALGRSVKRAPDYRLR